jgi:hypothetical protein
MEQVIEIPLQHPIKALDEEVAILKIRRPKAKDFRALGSFDKPYAALLDFAAALADLPPSVIDRLDVDDVPKVVGVVSGFLGQFPATGMKS